MTDPSPQAALAALVAAARRLAVAREIAGDVETRLLQSIVDATVRLFDAEAASIALFATDPDRLEFRVAAGERGAGAIGLAVPPTQGVAGYVYSTGEPLALSDVGSDPRFDRGAAEQTGYVPRSIAAVPLLDEDGTIGVLQVLDKRGSPTFSMADMELLAIFASQATVAIGSARIHDDMARLVRGMLAGLTPEADPAELDELAATVTAGLDRDEATPYWRVVDRVARLRDLGEAESELVADLVGVLATHAARQQRRRRTG